MSRKQAEKQGITPGFPRVSGDEPGAATPILTGGGFSPRERG